MGIRLELPQGWIGYFLPESEECLGLLKRYLLILLEPGSRHSVHEYNRQQPLPKGTGIGCLSWSSAIPPKLQITLTPSHLGQHASYAPPALNPQAAFILTTKDETIAVVITLGEELSYQLPIKHLLFLGTITRVSGNAFLSWAANYTGILN